MTELAFYSKFARPLVLSLPDQKDRILAASWLKKIQNEDSGSERLRTDYLKLLLFALQRQKLVGIFEDDPTSYETLEDFTQEYDLNTLAKLLIEKEHKDRQDRIKAQLKGQIGDFPPYSTDYSSDFKEYVAAQDIPGFGVHCFYAISKEPISNWRKVDKVVIPKVAKSAIDTMSPVPHGVSKKGPDSACICPPKDDSASEPSECRTRSKTPETQRKKKSKQFGRSPPTHPLGKPPPPEDRQAPQWGSNLTEIKNLIEFDDEEEEKPPTKSTGAVPKVKGKSVKIIYDDESSLQEIEQALKDFRKGDISGIHRKKGKSPMTEEMPSLPSDIGSPYQSIAGSLMPRDEYEEWRNENLDRSIWQEEVDQDSGVLNYFKQQLSSRDAKRHLTHLHGVSHASEPAKAGLRLTTPKLSPSPKRVLSSDKLITEDHLPALKKPCKTEDQIDPRKDQELSRLHEDLLAGIAENDDRLRREQEEFERREMKEREAARRAQEAHDKTMRKHHSKKKKKEATHIQPGSPEANAIFADYLHSLTEATKEEHSEDEDAPAIFEARPMDSYEGKYETTPPSARLVVREPNPNELMHMMPDEVFEVKHVAEDKYIEKTVAGEESQKFAKRVSAITETPKLGRLPQTDQAMEKKKRRSRTTEETRRRRLDFDDSNAPEVPILDQPIPAYLQEPMQYPPVERYTHQDMYSPPPPPECQCNALPSEQGSYHTPERTQRTLGPPGSYSTPDSFEREDIEDERYLKEMREKLEDVELRGWHIRSKRHGPQMSPVQESPPEDSYCYSPSEMESSGYSCLGSFEREEMEDARHMEEMREILEDTEIMDWGVRYELPGPQLSPIQEHHTGSSMEYEDYSAGSPESCACNDDYQQYSDEEYYSSPQTPNRVLNKTYTKRKFITNHQ